MPFPIFRRKKLSISEALIALSGSVKLSDTERIKILISEHPGLLEASDEKGRSPLHWAAEAQSLASVACLVDLGADPKRTDKLGFTPEQVACWYGEFRMGAYTDVCQRIVERLRAAPSCS